jgi:lactoylglutathione lyase
VREGYANFAVTGPPLKLVLIENPGQGGTLNHLGVEVEHTDQVAQAIGRLRDEGLETLVEDQTTCCFAVQDKVWVNGPDGEPWEVYTVLADAEAMHPAPSTCC